MKKGFLSIIIVLGLAITGLFVYLYLKEIPAILPDGGGNDNGDDDPDGVVISSENIIINHSHSHLEDLVNIPLTWIDAAKENLSIAYWHTSHGSQLTTGMASLDAFMGNNDIYEYSSDGSGSTLHYHEVSADYADRDLTGYTDQFDDRTREFLTANPVYNVIMWSWCALDKNNASINAYLTNMNQLESEYPDVQFVYMTGHLEGTGEAGDLHYYNQMIREYCISNNKTLYDFADIESYDPDDNYFLDKNADDGCNYDGGNWATEWQSTHDGANTYPNGGEWYSCSPAHTQALNGNLKAYGAWYLFARLAGWDGQ